MNAGAQVLHETDFPWLGKRYRGKVRDVYVQPDRVVLITTDRHSSFDRHLADIPRKGEVLNLLSAWWMRTTAQIVPNHIIDVPDSRVTIAHKCTTVPVEVVMRGYLTGVTSTSLWKQYEAGKRTFGNFVLPDGMRKNDRLAEPVFNPTTKEAEHDRGITPDEIVAEGLVTREMLQHIEHIARKLFAYGQAQAAARGLILVDTKYEFGLTDDGQLLLIDEVHTPDSSRYWNAGSYAARIAAGQEPEYFDKEFLRLWFIENADPYHDAELPPAPPDMVQELSQRYIQIYTTLTGEPLPPVPKEPTHERLKRMLASYAVHNA